MRAKKQETKNFHCPLHYKRLQGTESPSSDQSQQPWGSYSDCGLNSSLVLRLASSSTLFFQNSFFKKMYIQHVMNAIASFLFFSRGKMEKTC